MKRSEHNPLSWL